MERKYKVGDMVRFSPTAVKGIESYHWVWPGGELPEVARVVSVSEDGHVCSVGVPGEVWLDVGASEASCLELAAPQLPVTDLVGCLMEGVSLWSSRYGQVVIKSVHKDYEVYPIMVGGVVDQGGNKTSVVVLYTAFGEEFGHEGEGCSLFPSMLQRDWSRVPQKIPSDGTHFWFVTDACTVRDLRFDSSRGSHVALWWCGNFYLTQEAAEVAVQKCYEVHALVSKEVDGK